MITSKFTGSLVYSMDRQTNVPLPVELVYDGQNDPLAVSMVVTRPEGDDVVWTFALDLLSEGLHCTTSVGLADVRVRRDGARVLLCMRSPSGHAHLALPASRVEAFLDEVGEASPGCLETLMDEAIEEILNS